MLAFHIDMNFANLRPDYLRGWIDQLADLGYDTLLWEMEDKVRWESCPECVWPEAMDKATLRELLAYARARGMQNIPLLQTIGHAEYVLKHAPYQGWQEKPGFIDCYCTSNPEVRAFLKRWIVEIVDLFDTPAQMHLGGDEAYRFATCPRCRDIADRQGRNALYAQHINDLAEPLLARGVRPGIWCDMVLHHPDEMDAIPETFVIWDWNYWDGVESPAQARIWGQGLRTAESITEAELAAWPSIRDDAGNFVPFYTSEHLQRQGRDVVICSSTRSHGDAAACGQHTVHAPNVAGAAATAARHGMLGSCVTSWAIRLHPYETQGAWIALAAAAAQQPASPFDALLAQVAESRYGLGPELFEALAAIGMPLPMTVTRDIGIQFNDLKDPVQAPPGYLRKRLESWRDNGELPALRERLATGLEQVREGSRQLRVMAMQATRGQVELLAWTQAADLHLWMGRLGQLLLQQAAGEAIDRAAAQALHQQLRRAWQAWTAGWLTSGSAEHLAAIIFAPSAELLG